MRLERNMDFFARRRSIGKRGREKAERHIADLVVEDDVIAAEQVARVHWPGLQQDQFAAGQRTFLDEGGAENPRGLQCEHEEQEYQLHNQALVLTNYSFRSEER